MVTQRLFKWAHLCLVFPAQFFKTSPEVIHMLIQSLQSHLNDLLRLVGISDLVFENRQWFFVQLPWEYFIEPSYHFVVSLLLCGKVGENRVCIFEQLFADLLFSVYFGSVHVAWCKMFELIKLVQWQSTLNVILHLLKFLSILVLNVSEVPSQVIQLFSTGNLKILKVFFELCLNLLKVLIRNREIFFTLR